MTPEERSAVLALRKKRGTPWHSLPHWDSSHGETPRFLITGTCYNHVPVIGKDHNRLCAFSSGPLNLLKGNCLDVFAWCILTNHYHVLVRTDRIKYVRSELGRLHGCTSRTWNLEDGCIGRQVWHNCAERRMRSERHFWTTVNYVHHNPVRHGYVGRWQDWPWSSANEYLGKVGYEEALRIWKEYPLRGYGDKWDKDVMGRCAS